MKWYKMLTLLLCIVILFSGCHSFRLAPSIDDLIMPVSPSGDNAGVQNAVDEYCKGGYSIKIPTSGKYTTSFIFVDLNNDEIDEAVAFYEPSGSSGQVSMAVIEKTADKWSVIDDIEGVATDVNSVDFCDLTNDGSLEIIVCWSVISKSSGSTLSIYSQTEGKNGYKLKEIDKGVPAVDFVCVDINDDGITELLTFSNYSSSYSLSESPKANLYTYKSKKRYLFGQTKIDASITSIESIQCSKTDEGTSVYADAIKSDGSSMVTEFLYWSDYYSSVISPFYSYSTGRTSQTTRDNLITCRDIDSDGVTEIPIDTNLSKLPKEIGAENWVMYNHSVLSHKCYSISCKRDGLIVVIPDNIYKNISVEYSSEERKITVLIGKDKKPLLEIITVINSNYDSKNENYSEYTELFSNSGYVYLARVSEQSDENIDAKALSTMIKPY